MYMTSLYNSGVYGDYRSSSIHPTKDGYTLEFSSNSIYLADPCNRHDGFSIRFLSSSNSIRVI